MTATGLTTVGCLVRLVLVEVASEFVGRRRETDAVRDVLTGGRAMLVVGDAGVGKTRLMAEVKQRLESDGWVVGVAACLPLAQRLPLLPIVELLHGQHKMDGGESFKTALNRCPPYVRVDLAHLLPELGAPPSSRAEGPWQQQRLFAAVGSLWGVLAESQRCVVAIEDLHWSDQVTRDILTYLLAARPPLPLLLTSRTDEPEGDADARDWLRQSVRSKGLTRLMLGPLDRKDVRDMTASLLGTSVTDRVAEDLFRRTEGSPFFLEQLVASGAYGLGSVLSEELGQLLRARADLLAPSPRRLLELLAISARPLTETELVSGAGQPRQTVRQGLRELLFGQLVRRDAAMVTTRHALLSEAIAAALLPGERADLHAATAVILTNRADFSLAAEVALHWEHAEHPLAAGLAWREAAEYAESVCAYADAARHWERAFGLMSQADDAAAPEDALRALRAWASAGQELCGETVGIRGAQTAADRGERALVAALRSRVAMIHGVQDKERGLRELIEAVNLFDGLQPTGEQVAALHRLFQMFRAVGRTGDGMPFLERAVQLGETAILPAGVRVQPLTSLAYEQLEAGNVDEGLATLGTARQVAASGVGPEALGWLVVAEAYAAKSLNHLERCAETAEAGLARLRSAGLGQSWVAGLLVANLLQARLGRGDVDLAGAVIDPLTDNPTVPVDIILTAMRARVDITRGRIDQAVSRVEQVMALPRDAGPEMTSEFSNIQSELALWQGKASWAASLLEPVLDWLLGAGLESLAGPLLVLAMRGCADLAETAAARRDDEGLAAARTRARRLDRLVAESAVDPFAPHPFFAVNAAEGCDWFAERGRALRPLLEQEQVQRWAFAAESWERLQRPHRAGYARWRQSEALFQTGDRPTAAHALQTGWQQAEQHVPLRAQLMALARRGRVDVSSPVASELPQATPLTMAPPTPFDLTARELDVLRLVAAGLTNAQIGSRLYISSKTVSVHVTAILRKLDATNRVHAAAIAERAGIVASD